MLALGILSFAAAVALVFFAFKPDLAFRLDEGWKFRGKTEPSETYVAVNTVGRIIGAIVAIGVGIGAIAQYNSDQRSAREKQATDELYAAAEQRCASELRPRFNETANWNSGGQLTNPQEVQALAHDLGVEVEITTSAALRGVTNPPPPSTNLTVLDPTLPESHRTVLYYLGSPFGFDPTAVQCDITRPSSV
ncbi:hypothetical protein A5784_11575 [Mycobacterium sp. 852013-50091_SCH5140682]|uniref:DUF6199 family natural product biosynthesis protein n=1 Tax=Mycobacterium sp. 852013-50091_SCH5140682 TaxID=1834109 RepID=UPI0007EA826B|nr:DUF6199 family natural product biosynthesis protein [Mycobacterium sp. 852013-50091_SCH5140682]OBC05080.1 hypothetical protein A5784_11575 [Mycobacterium sp. 852013-50091_SCH5140682]